MSRNQRALLLALAVVVLVVGFVIARSAGDDDDSSSSTVASTQTQVQTTPTVAEPEDEAGSEADAGAEATEDEATGGAEAPEEPQETTQRIRARGGAPVDGVTDLAYDKGETVDFTVNSDIDEELHVHGYEVVKPLPAGKDVRVRFPASIDGRFEIELHGSGEQIAALEVQP